MIEKRNGFTDIKGCFPYCSGCASASSCLLHWSPSLLENLRHRPRHPQQQANCQRRSFPNRHGGSEICGVVSRRVRLRGSCRQSKAASSQSPFYTFCLVRYLLTYIHAGIHVIPHFIFPQFSDLLRWFFFYRDNNEVD